MLAREIVDAQPDMIDADQIDHVVDVTDEVVERRPR
jgi:hypothetical protein